VLAKLWENGILIGAGRNRAAGHGIHSLHLHRFRTDVFSHGVARFLFAPLAEAVVSRCWLSYALSRTLVPTLVMWFERNVNHTEHTNAAQVSPWIRPLVIFQTRL